MKTFFVISEVVLAGLVFIFNLLGMNSAVSISFAMSFIVILIYLAFSGIVRRVNKTLLLLVALSGINVIINGGTNHYVSFNFDYFKKLIFFYSSIIFFHSVTQIDIREKAAITIKYIILSISAFLVIDYYILGNHVMLGRYLTLGFTNPNFTAIWLMHLGLFLVYYFLTSQSKILRVFCVTVFVFFIYLIIQTQNRSTLLVYLFFFSMLIIGCLRKKYTLNSVAIILIIITPFLFFIFYRLILSNTAITRLFNFAVSLGKGLDSRSLIWNYATGLLLNKGWIIGDYASLHVNNATGMLQMHNSHLDVFVSYGVIPFILFLKLHFGILQTVNKKIATFPQYVSLCAFLSVIMLGTFEAGIYAGCTGLNFLSGTFLLLAAKNSETKLKNNRIGKVVLETNI